MVLSKTIYSCCECLDLRRYRINIQDFVGRHITSMFKPSQINVSKKEFEAIQINPILKKIIRYDDVINTKTEKF